MIRAIIDKRILIEKNTIQVNRILKDNEKFTLNKETELLFENSYLFPFAKFENDQIIELTEEEQKLKGLTKLQSNEAIINNKILRLQIYEKFENGKIVINEELKKEYINNRIIYLRNERVQLKENREKFIKYKEETLELDLKIELITKELKELEK